MIVAALSLAVLACLFAYGANGYLLLSRRRRWTAPPAAADGPWPDVLVQIPVYNERDVAARAVDAAVRLSYPGRVSIQILDDSDDDTPGIVARAIEAAGARVTVTHLRRERREGFKAGALALGLERSAAPLVAIFDADFVPPENFLLGTVPVLADEGIACVQTRWDHLNPADGLLTRAQALAIDVHFEVEQKARAAAGWPVAFNGSGGVWRRSALEGAGGSSGDTRTEDLDLSYRVALGGARIAYVDGVRCPGEIPADVAAFKAQQRRWARGSTEVARKLLGPIWRSGLTLGAKVQATLHLTHYFVHPLLLLSAALALPLGLTAGRASLLWTLLPPLAMATGGPLAMSIRAGRARGLPAVRIAQAAVGMMVLGVGLAVSNSRAVLAGLWGRQGRAAFVRTPKGGAQSSYRPSRDGLGPLEVAAGLACLAAGAWLWERGILGMVPFLFLYGLGLGCVGVATVSCDMNGLRSRAINAHAGEGIGTDCAKSGLG